MTLLVTRKSSPPLQAFKWGGEPHPAVAKDSSGRGYVMSGSDMWEIEIGDFIVGPMPSGGYSVYPPEAFEQHFSPIAEAG